MRILVYSLRGKPFIVSKHSCPIETHANSKTPVHCSIHLELISETIEVTHKRFTHITLECQSNG